MTPLIRLALGWTAGLWLASQWPAAAWGWPAAAGGLLLALGLQRRLAAGRWASAGPALGLALALALGAWRYQAAQPAWDDPAFVAAHAGAGVVTVTGVIADEPDVRDARTLLRVRVDQLELPGATTPQPAYGLVLVAAPRWSEARLAAAGQAAWQYGDQVRVTGALTIPPETEDFSYRDYLARLDVYAQLEQPRVDFQQAGQGWPPLQAVFHFKARALAALARLFPEPHAALLSGILLGVEAGLPPDLKTAFSRTGTSHLIAISGFNVALLVGLFMSLFRRFLSPNAAAGVTILVIAAYTVLVGASASVVRAALMGGLGVVGQRLGRSGGGLNALAFATLAMTLANPLTLWDVGFQLSASATLGLVLYGDRFQTACERGLRRWLSPERAKAGAALAADLVLITLAAQITTLPILLYYFRQLSLITLAANMVVLPVQPAVMILGGLAMLAGLVWLPLGQLVAWATWPLTAYTLAFVQFFAGAPGAAIGLGEVAPAAVVVFYAVLGAATWVLSRPADARPAWWTAFMRESAPAGGAGLLALAAVLAWSAALSWPETPGRLRVTLLETGPDPAVLIQTPAGNTALLNGGPSGGALTRGLARTLPLLHTRLEVLALAGTDAGALGGIPDLLERYAIGRAVVTGAAGRGPVYATVMQALTTPLSARERPAFDLGEGVVLRVVMDGPAGAAWRLEWGAFAMLLPGRWKDADASAALAAAMPAPVTVLIMPEAGLAAAAPAVAVWDPAVVLAATAPAGPADTAAWAGRTVLRTGEHGALTVTTDGRQMWVEAER